MATQSEPCAQAGATTSTASTPEKLSELFNLLDERGEGALSQPQLERAFALLSLPPPTGSTDGSQAGVSLGEFELTVRAALQRKRRTLFASIDKDGDGEWSAEELRASFHAEFESTEQLEKFVTTVMSRLDQDHSGRISYDEWTRGEVLSRADSISSLVRQYQALDCGEDGVVVHHSVRHLRTATQQLGIFVAGAAAGVVSRTATAPAERLKLMYQSGHASGPVLTTVRELVAHGGVRALWRGNVANCLKVAPAKAMKFLLYENVRVMISKNPSRPSFLENIVTGGAVSAVVTAGVHPIDTIKTRMSVLDRASSRTVRAAVAEIVAAEGPRGLLRGLSPALMSSVPFSAINMATFMTTKDMYKDWAQLPPVSAPPITVLLSLSVLSTLAAQLVAYPIFSVKVNIQSGRDAATWPSITRIVRERGVLGLYRGMGLNFLKSAPAVGVTFTAYEYSKPFLGIGA
eukprot:m.239714 g.239714  ORF g.239714 m.239714 type:complete len:461 (+) comp26265_c2_seq2:209-1591(+)